MRKFIAFLLVIVFVMTSCSGCVLLLSKKFFHEESKSEQVEQIEQTENAVFARLIEKGLLSKDFDENSNVSNRLFIAMLVEIFEYELSDSEYTIKGIDGIFMPYYNTVLEEGVVTFEETGDSTKDAIGRNIIKWTRNAMQMSNGEDDVFGGIAENDNVTVIRAYEMLSKAYARYKSLFSVRKDAENKLVLQDGVKVTSSSKTQNTLMAVDSSTGTVTFANADKTVSSVDVGNVLYITPSEALPYGFLAKISDKTVSNGAVSLVCTEPKINEVIKEADISTQISLGGKLDIYESENNEDSEKSPALETSTDSDFRGDAFRTEDGLEWYVVSTNRYYSGLHFETKNFQTKKGFYGSADLRLDLLVDFRMFATDLKIDKFIFITSAESMVSALAGYHTSGSLDEQIALTLETVTVPVAGPLTIELKPTLIIRGNGEFTVEVTPSITSVCSVIINDDKVILGSRAGADLELNANGEGRIEAGIEMGADVALLSLPFLKDEDVDIGFNIVEIKALFGAGLHGTVEFNKNLSTDGDNSPKPDENGVVHTCTFCVNGQFYCFDELEISLDKNLREFLKDTFDIDAVYKTEKDEMPLGKWYYSIGEGHEPECKKGICPYRGYEISVFVVDKNTKKPIPNVEVSLDGKTACSNIDGIAKLYADNGVYDLVALSGMCTPIKETTSVTVDGKAVSIVVPMNRTVDYYKFVAETLVPEYRLAPLENKTGKVHITGDSSEWDLDESQYGGQGIASAKITDINNDGTEDLIVLYFKKESEGRPVNPNEGNALFLSLYTVDENQKIVKLGEDFKLDWGNNINENGYAIGIAKIEGKNYIIEESCWTTTWFGSGNARTADLYGFDTDNTFKLLKSIGVKNITTNWGYDKLVCFYDYTENPDGDATLLTTEDTNFGEYKWKALQKGFDMMGLDIDIGNELDYPKLCLRSGGGADLMFATELDYGSYGGQNNYKLSFVEYTELRKILEKY